MKPTVASVSEIPESSLTFGEYSRRFAWPMWRWYLGGFFLLAAVNLVNLQIPQLAKNVINDVTANVDMSGSKDLALAVIGLGILLIVIRSLSRIVIFWPGRRLETATKSHLFGKLLRLPETFFFRHGMGDLISRLANDVGQLRAFYAFGLLQFLNVIFLLVFTIVRMVTVHSTLTFLSLLPLLIMFAVMRIAMPRMHTSSRENQKAMGELTNRVTEAFVNVQVIQANAAEGSFVERAERENERVYVTNMKLVFIRMAIFPLMSCLAGISQLIVLGYGGHEVIQGRLSVGDILAFNVYIGLLTFPLSAMGMILSLYQRAKTAIERIGAIDHAEPERCEISGGKPQPSPLLEIRDLSFAFSTPDGSVGTKCLNGISLQLTPGRRIGLFGKVGSGKSTLFNLVTRLYDPPANSVFLSGQDVLAIEPGTLRSRVGYAMQQVHLFSLSIRENLAFGIEPEPPQEELIKAAKAAQILGEIEGFEETWATEIGEKGLRLSGGQKQRLALARLFLRRPEILLLDDVLSAVDQNTEKKLLDHIYSLGCAMMIASHRGSALKRCDEILVLAEGNVLARGTFAELASRFPDLARDA